MLLDLDVIKINIYLKAKFARTKKSHYKLLGLARKIIRRTKTTISIIETHMKVAIEIEMPRRQTTRIRHDFVARDKQYKHARCAAESKHSARLTNT